MTTQERINWLINIENSAAFISEEIGNETVDFIIGKYGTSSSEEIASENLPDLFSELYAVEVDLRSG